MAALFGPGVARAGCGSPSGSAGYMMYNADCRVMQYCDGTNWYATGSAAMASALTATQLSGLTASDKDSSGDYFGNSVSLSGNLALVGAHYMGRNGHHHEGEAYLYDLTNPASPVETIIYDPGDSSDQFGEAVVISGHTLAIGAPIGPSGTGNGQVFIYDTSDLTTPEATITSGTTNDQFGSGLALSGNTLLIGAIGAGTNYGHVYIYDISNPASPALKATIANPTPTANVFFGARIAISGNLALIGQYGYALYEGDAYLYDISTLTSPVLKATITAADGATSDGFGYSVALSGTTALIGAYGHKVGSHTYQGAVYIYDVSTPSSPRLVKELTAADGAASDYFGGSLAVLGDRAAIGAYSKTAGGHSHQGMMYVFDISAPASPAQLAEFTSSDGAASNYFGNAVALDGDNVLVGAYYYGTYHQGKAYMFSLADGPPLFALARAVPAAALRAARAP